ncbi:MAG: hypothetical protein AAFQ87_25030, partial [Bacteroidota bacterium]
MTRQGAGLSPDEYNTFTVRKQDGLYYFFLNEQFFDVFGYEYIVPRSGVQITVGRLRPCPL